MTNAESLTNPSTLQAFKIAMRLGEFVPRLKSLDQLPKDHDIFRSWTIELADILGERHILFPNDYDNHNQPKPTLADKLTPLNEPVYAKNTIPSLIEQLLPLVDTRLLPDIDDTDPVRVVQSNEFMAYVAHSVASLIQTAPAHIKNELIKNCLNQYRIFDGVLFEGKKAHPFSEYGNQFINDAMINFLEHAIDPNHKVAHSKYLVNRPGIEIRISRFLNGVNSPLLAFVRPLNPNL